MVRIVVCLLAGATLVPPALAADATAVPDRSSAPRTPPAYVSAFTDYRAWREPTLIPWKRANEEVGRLGGHAGHLRGDATPAAKDEAPSDRPAEKR